MKPRAQSQDDSAAARNRALARGIFSSFASRGVAALAPLAMIPLMLPALGSDTYGVWMTIVSVTGMLIWADLGLGNGLMTRLSAHLARKDWQAARSDLLTTYLIVAGVAVVIAAVIVASPFFVSWSTLLNATNSSPSIVVSIVLVCMLCFCVNMPLSLIQRVQYAAQQVSISNTFTAVGPVLSLLLVLLVIQFESAQAAVILAATIGPLVANLAASIWFFSRNRHLIPKPGEPRQTRARTLLSLGSMFLIISTFSAFANNADSLVIAHVLGPAHVASFSVASRIMASMGLMITLVNLPFWPAGASALARGEAIWVRRTCRRMTVMSGAFVTVSSLAVLMIADPIVAFLGRDLVDKDPMLIASLGIWWAVVAFTSPMMMVQNAAGVLLPQLLGWTIFLVLGVPAKVLAVSHIGLYASPLAGAVLYVLVVIPFAAWGYRRSLDTLQPNLILTRSESAD